MKKGCLEQLTNLGEAAWHTGFPPSRSHHLAFFMRARSDSFAHAEGDIAKPDPAFYSPRI
jgi:hypothetical protein